jgi:uncharacterized protein UPF0236
VCQHCQADARMVSRRDKRILSLMGEVPIKRAYYHCKSCGRGHFPLDQEVGLNASHLTPAAAEVTCLAGVQTSFAQASETTLRKMCGLRLSESTVERTTESAGERLREMLETGATFAKPAGQSGSGQSSAWQWERDAQGRTCAYASADATGVRQQGEGGAKADGRMAYVGMIYNPRGAARTLARRPAAQPHQVRYLAGFYDLDELGRQLRRQAAQTGWDEAEVQIALSDGGAGLEDFFRRNFPLATVIIDFWHVKEHLVELAKAWFGEGSDEAKTWLNERCHQLKHEGGAAVLRVLETIDVTGRSDTVAEAHRRETNYFRNHHHKMDYPRYVANGWQIGSGPVESACKTVVNARLCASGMRWGSSGSDAVCHLRALYLSEPDQWESFWRNRSTKPAYN